MKSLVSCSPHALVGGERYEREGSERECQVVAPYTIQPRFHHHVVMWPFGKHTEVHMKTLFFRLT